MENEELAPSVYVVYACGQDETQIVGVYESESEAREVAEGRDKHQSGVQLRHSVEKTEFFKATSAV